MGRIRRKRLTTRARSYASTGAGATGPALLIYRTEGEGVQVTNGLSSEFTDLPKLQKYLQAASPEDIGRDAVTNMPQKVAYHVSGTGQAMFHLMGKGFTPGSIVNGGVCNRSIFGKGGLQTALVC
ncbi:hypothetical protein AX15_003090 [Amanita polypyramis BW_CC]|nr:hypothetical protein AX15_003090 [Amanita polypyramis BW_CC]